MAGALKLLPTLKSGFSGTSGERTDWPEYDTWSSGWDESYWDDIAHGNFKPEYTTLESLPAIQDGNVDEESPTVSEADEGEIACGHVDHEQRCTHIDGGLGFISNHAGHLWAEIVLLPIKAQHVLTAHILQVSLVLLAWSLKYITLVRSFSVYGIWDSGLTTSMSGFLELESIRHSHVTFGMEGSFVIDTDPEKQISYTFANGESQKSVSRVTSFDGLCQFAMQLLWTALTLLCLHVMRALGVIPDALRAWSTRVD